MKQTQTNTLQDNTEYIITLTGCIFKKYIRQTTQEIQEHNFHEEIDDDVKGGNPC